jgi:hypothetical protein
MMGKSLRKQIQDALNKPSPIGNEFVPEHLDKIILADTIEYHRDKTVYICEGRIIGIGAALRRI